MAVRVCKFGGSSLATAEQFRKVRAIIADHPDRRFVVPSAPGRRHDKDAKITDLLYLCHAAAAQDIAFDASFDPIAERYEQIVEQLDIDLDIHAALQQVRQEIAAGASADHVASRGEYLNGLILASLLDVAFVDPADVIHFDARGRFDPDATYTMLQSRMKQYDAAVIPGFYGSMPDGSIKTFSRGGSDVTGAIIARGVGAEVYENWTDVSGLLMADPRIIDAPHAIATVTYQELRELSYMGAGVLHDEAIFPVREAGIPVHILNTNAPSDSGTRIVAQARPLEGERAITGIAGRKDFTVISIEKALMNAEVGFGRRVLSVLEVHGVSFEHMPSSIDSLSVVVEDQAIEGKVDAIVADLKQECRPDQIDIDPNMALIATVGRGMSRKPGMAKRVFNALAEAQINIRMIDQGSSELNIIVGIDADDFETAIRAIYSEFVD